MPFEGADGLARGEVPYSQRLIVGGGDGDAAIRRHRHAAHKISMPFERADQRLGLAADRNALAQPRPPLLLERSLRPLLPPLNPHLEAPIAKLLQKEPRLLPRLPPAQTVSLPIQRPD